MQPPRPSPTTIAANLARILAAATTIALLTGCGSAGVVARIGTTTITQAETQHWTTAIAQTDDATVPQDSTKERAVNLLVLASWLTGEAHELGLNVNTQEANHQLELLEREGGKYPTLPRDPQLSALLLSQGLSRADQVWLMRLTLLAAKIEHARLPQAEREVPQVQIAAFYREHKRRFVLPARRSIEIIGNKSRALLIRAKREIEHGRSFLELARRISVDGEAPKGLQELIRGTDEEELEAPVFAAKPHVLVGPETGLFYFIFEVLKSTPARQQTVTEAEPTIRRELALARQVTATLEAKWRARTRCSPTYHTSKCTSRS